MFRNVNDAKTWFAVAPMVFLVGMLLGSALAPVSAAAQEEPPWPECTQDECTYWSPAKRSICLDTRGSAWTDCTMMDGRCFDGPCQIIV